MRKKYYFTVVSIFLLMLVSFNFNGCGNTDMQSEVKVLKAFPTAEGGGMYAVGGRGGKVIYVRNLNAKGKDSFREACESKGSRTVIFAIGGTIDLKGKDIIIHNDNITIAGQTALGGGIQIKNGGLRIEASEVIIRYIRIRLGPTHSTADALSVLSPNRHERKQNIIIDHVSAFWGVDETMNGGSFSNNVTIQWSIIAEGLHCSIYDNNGIGESWRPCKEVDGKSIWAHSRGSMITSDSRNITYHHNLLYKNYKRNPLIQSSDADIVNNVIVNPQYQAYIQPFKGIVKVNFVGNYFRSYTHKRPPIRVFEYSNGYDANSSIYYKDNYDAIFRQDKNQPETDIRIIHKKKKENNDGHIKDSIVRHPFKKVITQPVHEAYNIVLNRVGANYPKRDEADKRVINEVRTGVAPKTLVNDPSEVGGWPILLNGVEPKDSDADGMPDKWELSNGLEPDNSKDRNKIEISTAGYTNLEVYLNSLLIF